MRLSLSSVIMLCCFLLWCVFVLTIGRSWNLLFLCDWTCLTRMPRPIALNNTAITLITDQTRSVSGASGFNFLECLIGYRKHKPKKNKKVWHILMSWECWNEMLLPFGDFMKTSHVHVEHNFHWSNIGALWIQTVIGVMIASALPLVPSSKA